MAKASEISKLLMYAILLFAIAGGFITDLKRDMYLLAFICIIIGLAGRIISYSRKTIVPDILLFIMVFFFSITIINFIVDSILPPKIHAVDCKGHHAMYMGWVKGIAGGVVLTFVLSFFYFKRRPPKTKLDTVLSALCLVLLICTSLQWQPFIKINDYITRVSMPVIIYPDGC